MVTILSEVSWRSPPLASFEMPAAEVEERSGNACARDVDSNGVGLFDGALPRFRPAANPTVTNRLVAQRPAAVNRMAASVVESTIGRGERREGRVARCAT